MSQHRQPSRARRTLFRAGPLLGALIVIGGLLAAGGAWALTRNDGSAHRETADPTVSASSSAVSTPVATPLATPTPRNCTASPHLCGYPDATNTGVPTGTTLQQVPGQVSRGKGWYYDPRGWIEVDGKGAVLQDVSTSHTIDITGSDVTIKDVRVTLSGNNFGIDLRHTHNVIIEDSDISSPYSGPNRLMVGIKDVFGDSTGTKILQNNIWHTATGVQVAAGLIDDNYIHDFGYRSGDHVNGVTVNGGTTPLTIEHNTIFVNLSQTDAISLFEDFGVEANKVIEDNLVAGGSYSIYGGQNAGGPTAYNIRIIGNRFSRKYYPLGGQFGPLAAFNSHARGNVWSGNIWDDSETVIRGF